MTSILKKGSGNSKKQYWNERLKKRNSHPLLQWQKEATHSSLPQGVL